ncbi:FkbM family methyltransferase [Lichenibacterium minor]|uniref:FkbM family methyltransferase n=1 Tax=Lichenibacterium minor TaxID=2316528 RepID=A0A4V1RUA6_9HYPH|nr:FkbM family methyltransferase [Lichenibacterium minor]RYC30484.1 FkbM family methyltransferase [Lichenibacterium minor]
MTVSRRAPSFAGLTGSTVDVKVVDVGANPIDGPAPYATLMSNGATSVVGFEPNPEALDRLNAARSPHELYMPLVVGDGERHRLRICQAPGMTSLLEPDPAVLALFAGFPEWGKVVETLDVDTVRLDDVPATADLDLLKIDIQGAELLVFRNAVDRLAGAVVVQTEVEFLPLYVDQPLFADVDQFLRRQGFMFHRFVQPTSRVIKPLAVADDPYAGLSQLVWADAVFIKDVLALDRLTDRRLMAMARIMHEVYGAFDVVVRVLNEIDRRSGTRLEVDYMDGLHRHAAVTSGSAPATAA